MHVYILLKYGTMSESVSLRRPCISDNNNHCFDCCCCTGIQMMPTTSAAIPAMTADLSATMQPQPESINNVATIAGGVAATVFVTAIIIIVVIIVVMVMRR